MVCNQYATITGVILIPKWLRPEAFKDFINTGNPYQRSKRGKIVKLIRRNGVIGFRYLSNKEKNKL